MLVGLVIALVLAGCTSGGAEQRSSGGPDRTAASRTPRSTPEPDPATQPPTTEPPAPSGTRLQTAANEGAWDLVLTDVRVASHEGYDRVVLDFAGTGVPGWSVEYVDEPVLEGSGDVVPLDGDSVLQIVASGTTYPNPEGADWRGPRQFRPTASDRVSEVYAGGAFEGYSQVFAGLTGEPTRFRVFALADPSRLVVDVGPGA